MATVIDVAKKAKVSPSTVSRYIRLPEMVSKEKSDKIQQAIYELGYTPNLGASFLKSRRSNLVGLVLPSIYNSFFAAFIEKLSKKLKECHRQLLVFYASDSDDAKVQIKTLLSFQASSILFTLEKKSHTLVNLSKNTDCYLLQLFTDCFPQFDSVTVDDTLGTLLATEKLIAEGHRRILLIDRNNNVFLKRAEGFQEAFNNAGLICPEGSLLSLEDNSDMLRIIADKITSFKPTAVIGVTEVLAQKICLVFQSLNMKIPDDISFICYDDSSWANLSSYSAVAQPMDTLIDKVVRLVLKNHKGGDSPDKYVLAPILLDRKSIRKV